MSRGDLPENKYGIFICWPNYIDGVIPSDVVMRKQGKLYIETQFLVDANVKDARQFIFGKLHGVASFS